MIHLNYNKKPGVTMKTIKRHSIQEIVELYFDCPYCGKIVSDDDVDLDGVANVKCPNCNKIVKIVD